MAHRTTQEALRDYADREHSFIKHTVLESYLQRCLMITGMKFRKLAFIDGFAGPWQSSTSDLSDTSPGIAMKVMAGCQAALKERHRRDVRIRSIFVEADETPARKLEAHVQTAALSSIVRPEIWRGSFQERLPDMLRWLERDEFAFVFVDPWGWKGLVNAGTLAPLLQRPKTELLITFMWNFVNLATGHAEQASNLDSIFGEGWSSMVVGGGEGKGAALMQLYRRQLTQAAQANNASRLRTAMVPVEYVDKKKVVFYLVYATHDATGLVVFCEQAEQTARAQSQLKLQHRLEAIAKRTAQIDFFLADDHVDVQRPSGTDIRKLWLGLFPAVGSEVLVGYEAIADLLEASDCRISELQAVLSELISEGIVENRSARRARPKNAVNYKNDERLARCR